MNLLLIEPSTSIASMIESALADVGCEITHCPSHKKAIQSVKTQSFDLIASSQFTEDRDAFTFCEKLRHQEGYESTPFLVYSSDPSETLGKQAAEKGVTEVLNKLEISEKLLEYVERIKSTYVPIEGKVLIVEDSKSQQRLLANAMTDLGLSVDTVETVEQACQLASQQVYSLVITDMYLASSFTALELVSQIRHLPKPHSFSCIIAISSFDDQSRRRELIARGIDLFMPKPVDLVELKLFTRHLLRRYQTLASMMQFTDSLRRQSTAQKKSLSITYIEDNKVLQILMKSFVESMHQVQIEVFTEGKQGIEYITQHQPDLVFSDINLPDMTGWDIAEQLRANESTATLPIIAVTGEIMNLEKQNKAEQLFDGFIAKPFDKDKIVELIENYR